MRWFAASGGLRAWGGCLRGRRVTSGVMEMTARAGKGCSYGVVEGAARSSGELQGDGALLRATRKEKHQKMRRHQGEQMIPSGGAGDTSMAGNTDVWCHGGGALVRNFGGLEAWNGEGCGGTERGRRGPLIGLWKEGDRGHKGRDCCGRWRSPL